MKSLNIYLSIVFLFVNIEACLSVTNDNYHLVWADEFNGEGRLDSMKWDYELGYVRNNELQYYTDRIENVRQFNGNLEITILPKKMNGFQYTSASIITKDRAEWLYGKIEGRFKMPKGKGFWSCFWTLGSSIDDIGWPKCGEIDIFEHIDDENIAHGTAHWANEVDKHTSKGNQTEINVEEWHVYSIEWTPKNISWLIDGKKYHEINIENGINSTSEFHKPHYILVNFPIGGAWPQKPDVTTKLPATMYCDYIRVYQLK